MLGKAMRFVTVWILAFAICGKADCYQGTAASKGTTEDLEHRSRHETNFEDHLSTTSSGFGGRRLAAIALAVTSADAFAPGNIHSLGVRLSQMDNNTAFAPILTNPNLGKAMPIAMGPPPLGLRPSAMETAGPGSGQSYEEKLDYYLLNNVEGTRNLIERKGGRRSFIEGLSPEARRLFIKGRMESMDAEEVAEADPIEAAPMVAPGVRRNALSGSRFRPSAMEAAGPGSGIPDASGQGSLMDEIKKRITADLKGPWKGLDEIGRGELKGSWQRVWYREALHDFLLNNDDAVPRTTIEKADIMLKLFKQDKRLSIQSSRDPEAAAAGMTKDQEAEYQIYREALGDFVHN